MCQYFIIWQSTVKNSKFILYYWKDNNYDINATLKQDEILMLVNEEVSMIPQQHYYNNKVAITTQETPQIAATYSIKIKLKH